MRKVLVVVLALVAASVGVGGVTAADQPKPPRWVQHVQNYPGGISNGVRATLDQPTQRASQGQPNGDSRRGLSNVKMNDDPATPNLPQNETQVVISLKDPMTAVSASNDYYSGGMWIGRTTDGGLTWSNYRVLPTTSTGLACGAGGDPALAYSRKDLAFYAAQLCFYRNSSESEIQLYKSADEGATWTPSASGATVVTNIASSGKVDDSVFYDKELIAIDNFSSSSNYGRIYVTYTKFHSLPGGFSDYCPIQVAYSDHVSTANPRTSSWKHVGVVPDMPGNGEGPGANQFSTPVVDSQGGLDIAYASEDCNTALDRALYFRRSADGGATFGPAVQIDHPGEFVDNPDLADHLPNKLFRAPLSPSLAFNPVSGTLEYVYQNNVNRLVSGADISFQQSKDFGRTWSHAKFISITKDGAPAPNDQYMPWIAVDEIGNLHAIWYDNRSDPENKMMETWQALSTDDGATWTNFNISSVAWDPENGFRSSGSFIGDYNGIAASTSVIYPVWSDGRNSPGAPDGKTDIYTNVEIRRADNN